MFTTIMIGAIFSPKVIVKFVLKTRESLSQCQRGMRQFSGVLFSRVFCSRMRVGNSHAYTATDWLARFGKNHRKSVEAIGKTRLILCD